MKDEVKIAAVTDKLEEIKLEAVGIEEKVDDGVKRSSLSKFFRFKGFKSVSTNDVSDGGSKPSTLTRLFGKKEKGIEEAQGDVETQDGIKTGSEPLARRSFVMRGFVNVVPWISRKSSQMNLHKKAELTVNEDDDSLPQEIATSSEIF